MLVCSIDNESCMYYQNFPSHRCTDYPDPSVFSEFLRTKLQEEEITYSEWVSEEGKTLMKKVIDQADVFVEKLTLKLQQLCRHHYISDKEGKFFKQLKENLKEEECLILLDFAENYSLMIQDEVHSHHWSCQQATLHNVVVYYFAGGSLSHQSFCFISDYLTHGAQSVHAFIQDLVPKLKNLSRMIRTLLFS